MVNAWPAGGASILPGVELLYTALGSYTEDL